MQFAGPGEARLGASMRSYRSFLATLMLVAAAACASAPEPAIPFADRLAAAKAAGNPYQEDAALTQLLADPQLKPEQRAEALYQRASNLSLEEMQANLTKSMSGRNFYHGGFEDKMTRREAALTLGVRESASAERIKEAHRRILRINHPDMGGSTYLAFKVNEAKELLIKGKE